jgi:type I restriction enzyme S subunit
MSWRKRKVGDFAKIKHGWTFKGEFFADSGSYILLTPGNAHESGGLKLRTGKEKYYSGDFPPEFLMKRGDMLVIMTDLVQAAPILGGAILIPEDDRFLHNQRLGLVEFLPESPIDRDFLYYSLNSPNYRAQVRGSATGATVRHTAPTRICECEILVPDSIAEQQQVSKILSSYDNLIGTNRRRIALLEESVRLLYREWFVNLRFPGHELVKWRNGLPEGWSLVPLSAVAEVNRASLSAKSAPDVIQYIDIASVEPGVIREVTEMPFAEAPGRARRIVQHGDVIWSCVRPNRKSFSLIWEPDDNWVVSTGFAVLSAKSIPFSYLYLATTSDEFTAFLSNRATGAAYPAVTAKDFEASEVLVPSPDVLKDFHERCEQSFCLKHNLLKQNIALAKACDELLPKLMSGAIRV